MQGQFPSCQFFDALRQRIEEQSTQFEQLGLFDTAFGIRICNDIGASESLFVLRFKDYACTGIREVSEAGDDIDFVLEAPLRVWRSILGRVADGSINTLTHHDDPVRVSYANPAGHDKLFRFQASIQLVFDLAAEIASEA